MSAVHYIVAAYLGPRRKEYAPQAADRLLFLREHLASLARLKHALSHITVVLQVDDRSADWDHRLAEIIPATIQQTPVTVLMRPNDNGFSYSALAAAMTESYEFTIFNEDDYIFTVDHFDQFLVDQLRTHADVSLVCGCVRNDGKDYAAVSVGIMRSHRDLNQYAAMSQPGWTTADHAQVLWAYTLRSRGRLTDWLHYYGTAFHEPPNCVRWLERPPALQLGETTEQDPISVEPQFRTALIVPISALDQDISMHYWSSGHGRWLQRQGRCTRSGAFLPIGSTISDWAGHGT